MKFEELPMREYCMYALGADHARDFEEYKRQFIQIFLLKDEKNPNIEKDNKAESYFKPRELRDLNL